MAICNSALSFLPSSLPALTTAATLPSAHPTPRSRMFGMHGQLPSIHTPQMLSVRRRNSNSCCKSFTKAQEGAVQMEETGEEELMGEIGDELDSLIQSHEGEDVGAVSLCRALYLVDLIQRLGIQRFFPIQINSALHTAFMKWDEKNGMDCAEATVLAFRLLRLHGYPVSAGVLESLKDGEKGFSTSFSIATYDEIIGTINLYKCSQTGFPSESEIMDEAEEFAKAQLQRSLSQGDSALLQTNNLRTEIMFALEFPRKCLPPRLESRSIVRQLWPGNGVTEKCLKLVKLDLQVLQKLYQQELDEIERWWVQHKFDKAEPARKKTEIALFLAALGLFEPRFSAYRIAFAKCVALIILIDDLFDDMQINFEQHHRICEAIKRWDTSLINDLPQQKLVVTGMLNSVLDMAADASKVQGRDVVPLFKHVWISDADHYFKEAQWSHGQYIPTFDEYIKVACKSALGMTLAYAPQFLSKEMIRADMSSHIGIDSHFMFVAGFVCRLMNDLATSERESRGGMEANAITCYMRDHPGCTKEEAIASINVMIDSSCKELELALYQSRSTVPECCSRAIINMARCCCLVYRRGDNFTEFSDEYMDLLKDYFYDPLE